MRCFSVYIVLSLWLISIAVSRGGDDASAGELSASQVQLREAVELLNRKMPASGFVKYSISNNIAPNEPPLYISADQVQQTFKSAWHQQDYFVKNLTWPVEEPATHLVGDCSGKSGKFFWNILKNQVNTFEKDSDGSEYDPEKDNNPVYSDVTHKFSMIEEIFALRWGDLQGLWEIGEKGIQASHDDWGDVLANVKFASDGNLEQITAYEANARTKIGLRVVYSGWFETPLGSYPREIAMYQINPEAEDSSKLISKTTLLEIDQLDVARHKKLMHYSAHIEPEYFKFYVYTNGFHFLVDGENLVYVAQASNNSFRSPYIVVVLLFLVSVTLIWIWVRFRKNPDRSKT